MRVKIYCKTIAMVQSRGALSSLGMDTDRIFRPTFLLGRELEETKDEGLSRIEISYYADDLLAE